MCSFGVTSIKASEEDEKMIKEAQRGSTEMEAYRNLMEILGIEIPSEPEKQSETM